MRSLASFYLRIVVCQSYSRLGHKIRQYRGTPSFAGCLGTPSGLPRFPVASRFSATGQRLRCRSQRYYPVAVVSNDR